MFYNAQTLSYVDEHRRDRDALLTQTLCSEIEHVAYVSLTGAHKICRKQRGMSRCVISSFEKLSATLNRIFNCQRRERLAIRSKDRHRGVDAVCTNNIHGDVRALG